MNLSDIKKNVNSFISDSSTDRVSEDERYQAITEATAWLLEELGNEHMTDRKEIEYLPTVTWYKMDNLTPYLLTAGQLRFKEEKSDRIDFTRIEARDLATMPKNQCAYAIEQYNGDAYMGIVTSDDVEPRHSNLFGLDRKDGQTYTGTNATNIVGESDSIRYDMAASGTTSTSIETTSSATDLSYYSNNGYIIFEIEIPDLTDVTSISVKFGSNLSTDYYLGTTTTDVNGGDLVEGVNTVKFLIADMTVIGSPDISSVTLWSFITNHATTKPIAYDFRLSDLRVVEPVTLTFKYIFYRVGKDASGTDIIEFTADTDIPFFIDRYPQYKFAVAHKAAASLHRIMRAFASAGSEESLAKKALKRYKKNFSNERDNANSAFRPAGISFRNRRIRRTRN
jgi:hypothetical protein